MLLVSSYLAEEAVAIPVHKPTLSHKIRLTPNGHQQTYFKKACGVSRFSWNWGLSHWQQSYEKGEKPNALELKKQFNAIKEESYPWTYEVTKYASQQPFIHLQSAFQGFFQKQSRYPRFKKKGVHDSFYIGGDQVQVNGKRIRIRNIRQDALHKLTLSSVNYYSPQRQLEFPLPHVFLTCDVTTSHHR